jgi:large subunit ribosomal protein L10
MTREEKKALVHQLRDEISSNPFFYFADSSTLTVEAVNNLRRLCHEQGVKMRVVKNTLVKKALEDAEIDYSGLYEVLSGPTTLMVSDVSNQPAKVIREFRKKSEKPVLKAAWIDSDIFIGDDQLSTLADLKSKEELIGEVILLLQSPAKNVVGALQSGGQTIAGLIKTLSEREG